MIPEGTEFTGLRCDAFPVADSLSAFRGSAFSRLEIEPPGRMAMPEVRVTSDYILHPSPFSPPGRQFPAVLEFPGLTMTVLENAYCLPFAPPMLLDSKQVVTEYLIPWAPHVVGWFSYAGPDTYRLVAPLRPAQPQFEFETAFYLDHSVSGHYGHFLADCLPRMYAYEVARTLFGDVKVIVAGNKAPDFQTHLLNAAGVPSRDIVRFDSLVHCARLVLATQSMAVEHYASPTSARLWNGIRDRSAVRDVSSPDKIYLSRSGVRARKLINEAEVERIFAVQGFKIIRPETLRVEEQVSLVANARLLAGTSGSGLYNLAFQGRLRSAFILAWEHFVLLSEMLFCAGRNCDIWYHIGRSAPPERDSWVVDLPRLEADLAEWLGAAG